MEWKPEYRVGEQNPIALIQLATDTKVLLFHLPPMSFRIPTCLKNLLEDPKIKKIGFGLSEDMKKLCSQKVSVKASYDLDLLIKSLGCIRTSLQSLAARVLDIYIDKRKKITCSNWEKTLTREQILYAATDAWIVLKLYQKLHPHLNMGNILLFDHYCFICNQDLGANTRLFIHMLYHHYTTAFPCLLCSKVFGSLVAVQNHISAHQNGHICKVCAFEFPDIISCVYHKMEANHHDYLIHINRLTKSSPSQVGYDGIYQSNSTFKNQSSNYINGNGNFSTYSYANPGYPGSDAIFGFPSSSPSVLPKKTIPCPLCKRVFRTQNGLYDHFNSKHSDIAHHPLPDGNTPTLMV